MRSLAIAALTASFALNTAFTQTTGTKPSTTHRSTATTAKRKTTSATTTATPDSGEGLAAVGTMPAVTGPAKTLYTLKYVDLKLGTGELAQPHKFYTVNYTGWTTDGKKFDSSYDHDGGQPFVFPAGARRVITGWDTGFEGMRVGGKRRLIVPYQLAYGELGRPPIPPKADLIFDLELLAQSDAPPQQPPAVPPPGSAPAAQPPAKPETKPVQQPGSNPVTDPKNQTNVPATEKPQK